MLASCSQDTHIRLWKIVNDKNPVQYDSVADLSPDEDIRPKSDCFTYELMDASIAGYYFSFNCPLEFSQRCHCIIHQHETMNLFMNDPLLPISFLDIPDEPVIISYCVSLDAVLSG